NLLKAQDSAGRGQVGTCPLGGARGSCGPPASSPQCWDGGRDCARRTNDSPMTGANVAALHPLLARREPGDRLAQTDAAPCGQLFVEASVALEEQHDGRAEVERHDLLTAADRERRVVRPRLDAGRAAVAHATALPPFRVEGGR